MAQASRTKFQDRDERIYEEYVRDPKTTLQAVGERHGISRQRTHQIIQRVTKKKTEGSSTQAA